MSRLLALVFLIVPHSAFAHVKWFTDHSINQPPVHWSELNYPSFWFLFLLSMITLAIFVYFDRKFESWKPYDQVNKWLKSFADRSVVVVRVFTGASLLLTWQSDAMIAPELAIPHPIWGWFQFAIALGLLLSYTTPLSGLGMVFLWFFAMTQYGFFHLLDYLIYPAIGLFLLFSSFKNPKVYNLRVPTLYIGLGFSLCWAALEKIFHPHWGLDVLSQKPALTMGLDPEFFLLACAFVEFSLGYLLIIGLLQRPLALTITLVFITTTAFFGRVEIIGHTILHGALIAFIILGPGNYYPPPIEFHKRLGLRSAFAAVNFAVVFLILALPYWYFSQRIFEQNVGH